MSNEKRPWFKPELSIDGVAIIALMVTSIAMLAVDHEKLQEMHNQVDRNGDILQVVARNQMMVFTALNNFLPKPVIPEPIP